MSHRRLAQLSVAGQVSLTPHEGRALVAGVLSEERARDHDDDGNSQDNTLELDWSAYPDEAVVHNTGVTADAEGLHADDSDSPTTAGDLSKLSIVEILAAILDVRLITREKSEAQQASEAAVVGVDRRRFFYMRVSHDSTTQQLLSVGVSGESLEEAAGAETLLTETMRFGFTFFMNDDDNPERRTCEVYSMPFDTTIEIDSRRPYLSYGGYDLLGANPKPVGALDIFDQGDLVEDWEVDDVGAGMLTEIGNDDTTGITIRRSFVGHVALHVAYPAEDHEYGVEDINGVEIAGGMVWAFLSKTVYTITVSKPTSCTIARVGTTEQDLIFTLNEGESLAMCAELTAGRQARYKADPPAATPGSGYAHTYTTAVVNRSQLTLVATGGAASDATTFYISVQESELGAVQAQPEGGHHWDQMQARGVRRAARAFLRKTARTPEDIANVLVPAEDDAPIAHMFEHFEWPNSGNAFFGFDTARAINPVVLASTGPVELDELTEGEAMDGTDLVAGERVLLKDQEDLSENGVYIVASQEAGVPRRAPDFAGATAANALVYVSGGNVNQGRSFRCGTAVEVGSSPVEFTEYVRWPLVQRVDFGLPSGDQSSLLLKIVADGYHRYTFAQSDAVHVDASGHMYARRQSGGQIYMNPPISLKFWPVSADTSSWNEVGMLHARTIDVNDNVSEWDYSGG